MRIGRRNERRSDCNFAAYRDAVARAFAERTSRAPVAAAFHAGRGSGAQQFLYIHGISGVATVEDGNATGATPGRILRSGTDTVTVPTA